MNPIFQPEFKRVFGTFPLQGDELKNALASALQVGYRHIDTAQWYGNETEVGEVIAASGIPRDELMITTKVLPDNFSADKFVPSAKESLEKLQLDQVDLLLLHWPPLDGSDIEPSLKLLEQCHAEGLASHIGISNYTAAMMRRAKEIVGVKLLCNQVEFQPLLDQSVLMAAAAATGIPLTAYCSVARGEVFKHALFADIGQAVGKSAGQVVLRWILQHDVAPITMSTKEANQRANFDIYDFELSAEQMAQIDALAAATNYRVVTAELVPGAPDWD